MRLNLTADELCGAREWMIIQIQSIYLQEQANKLNLTADI